MRFKSYIVLFISYLFVLTACQSQSGDQEGQAVKTDTLAINSLETVISTESQLLGEPRDIEALDGNQIAVYDHGFKQVIVFNNDGEQQRAFGKIGEGPGEWGEMSGAADLEYLNGHFFTTNRSRFLFDLYDKKGNHLKSVSFPQHLNYSHKTLLPDDKLLVTTNGRDNALAAVLDLNEVGKTIQTIGSPESEFSEKRNFELERSAYAEGEIPENALNEALAAKGEEGYFLFMNTLGELRHYSDEGKLIAKQEIPENITKPVFDYVVTQNREEERRNTVTPLEFAQEMKVHNDRIYIFMPKPHPLAEDLNSQLLVFNSDGKFISHYIFEDPDNKSFLYDMAIGGNNIYFIDIMNAQILKFNPTI